MSYIADNSNNLRGFRMSPIPDDLLANGVLIRRVLVHERLIDQRYAGAVHAILSGEWPAAQNLNPERGKISTTHRRYIRFHVPGISRERPSQKMERPIVRK